MRGRSIHTPTGNHSPLLCKKAKNSLVLQSELRWDQASFCHWDHSKRGRCVWSANMRTSEISNTSLSVPFVSVLSSFILLIPKILRPQVYSSRGLPLYSSLISPKGSCKPLNMFASISVVLLRECLEPTPPKSLWNPHNPKTLWPSTVLSVE